MAPRSKELHRIVVFVLKIVRRRNKAIIGTFSVLVFSLLGIIWRQKSWKRLPPGPWGVPVVGILPHLLAVDNPGRKVRNMAQLYGEIFCAKLGNHRVVFLNGIEPMKESIAYREGLYSCKETSHRFMEYINFSFDFPSSNLTIKNQRQRRMVQSVLHHLISEQTTGDIHEKIMNECEIILEEIRRSAVKPDSLVDPAILLAYAVPNVLMSIIFNIRFDLEDPDYVLFLENFCHVQNVNDPTVGDVQSLKGDVLESFANSMRSIRTTDGKWEDLVSCVEKRLNMERDDISTAVEEFLTGVEKEDVNALESPFTMNLLLVYALTYVAELSLSIVGGVTWCLLFILKYPHIQENLHRELDRVDGDGSRNDFIKPAELPKMPYLAAVSQESSRYSPLTYLSLQYRTESELKLGSYMIPRETFVFHNLWSLLHDQKHYPLPHRFNPDRFLYNHQTFIEDERVRFIHFGNRGVRGDLPSIPETVRFILLSNILHRFSLSSPTDREELPTEAVNGLVKFPKPYQIKFRLRQRKASKE